MINIIPSWISSRITRSADISPYGEIHITVCSDEMYAIFLVNFFALVIVSPISSVYSKHSESPFAPVNPLTLSLKIAKVLNFNLALKDNLERNK